MRGSISNVCVFVCVACRAATNANQYRSAEQESKKLRKKCRRLGQTEKQLADHRKKSDQVREFRRAANEAAAEARAAEKRQQDLEDEVAKLRKR